MKPMNYFERGLACCGHAVWRRYAPAAPSPSPPIETTPAAKEPDVIYVPTPQSAVDRMLEMAKIEKGDLLYDLGCGDGRILVTAAKRYGIKAVGYDIDPERIKESRENVRTNGVEHLVTIKQADIFTLDLRDANVVTLYLLPQLNVRLMPQLRQLKPGSRIVSHDFDMRGAEPNEVAKVMVAYEDGDAVEHTIYKWIVPWSEQKDTASE
jgi:ubiquinone/menaquinone biosynthesis C-methylase UbiE